LFGRHKEEYLVDIRCEMTPPQRESSDDLSPDQSALPATSKKQTRTKRGSKAGEPLAKKKKAKKSPSSVDKGKGKAVDKGKGKAVGGGAKGKAVGGGGGASSQAGPSGSSGYKPAKASSSAAPGPVTRSTSKRKNPKTTSSSDPKIFPGTPPKGPYAKKKKLPFTQSVSPEDLEELSTNNDESGRDVEGPFDDSVIPQDTADEEVDKEVDDDESDGHEEEDEHDGDSEPPIILDDPQDEDYAE
jgi:hypothetical protein